MANRWNRWVKQLYITNATTAPASGGSGSFNRDPKVITVKRLGYQLVDGEGGRESFEASPVDFNLIATAIQRDSYIMQAVLKYSELLFKSGWYFKGKNDQSLEYLRLRLSVMAVATGIPTEELFQGIGSDVVRYANSFLVKARAKNGVGLPPGVSLIPILPSKEPIAGYFRLPPQTITISREKDGTILGYRQEVEGGGDPIDFKPEDIIHISINRPVGQAFGLPFLAAVLEDVRLLRKVEENAALLLYRHIFPLLTYTVGNDKPGFEATDEEIAELQQVIENMPTDGAILLPERHKVEAVKINAMDGKPYLDYFEQRVFTGLGMSSVDMGRGDTANRNTADAMSGIKADRVKGWQQELQTQIDKYIIDELLIEGGFDPIVTPDADIDFVFEEIELERKIAKENHAILKWNSQLATFEETRIDLGYDPTADEARLQYQMIGQAMGAASAEPSTAKETTNKNAPENQNGARSAPKKSTESVLTSTSIQSSIQTLTTSLQSVFQTMEQEILDTLSTQLEKNRFPLESSHEYMRFFTWNQPVIERIIFPMLQTTLLEGKTKGMQEMSRNRISFPATRAMHQAKEYTKESIELLEKRLKRTLEKELKGMESKEEAIRKAKGVFLATSHRWETLSEMLILKTYYYGYALALQASGETSVRVETVGSCLACQEKSGTTISLVDWSSLEERAVFYKMPPWHPHCHCHVTSDKGGENGDEI